MRKTLVESKSNAAQLGKLAEQNDLLCKTNVNLLRAKTFAIQFGEKYLSKPIYSLNMGTNKRTIEMRM